MITSNEEKELEYYLSGNTQKPNTKWGKPSWVPSRVKVLRLVRSEIPGNRAFVEPGEYDCECNQYGAVAVMCSNGKKMLGLRLDEFKPLAWRENEHATVAS